MTIYREALHFSPAADAGYLETTGGIGWHGLLKRTLRAAGARPRADCPGFFM